MLRRLLAPLVASCIALVLAPAGASAAELTLSPRSQQARPAQTVKLRATAPASGTCQLRVDGLRMRVTTTATRTFVIRARVSRRARPGAHSLSLRCSAHRARTRVTVARSAGNRKARGGLFRSLRISAAQAPESGALQEAPAQSPGDYAPVTISTAPFPRPVIRASAQALLFWASNALSIGNVFRNGQCTDWAQLRRPDVVQSVYMSHFDRFDGGGVVESWNAQYWAQLAAQAGVPVGRSPVVGAVMVFAPGVHGAGGVGHVAVVEAVRSDGSFVISHMNAPTVGKVDQRTYSAQTAGAMATDPGIAFIL